MCGIREYFSSFSLGRNRPTNDQIRVTLGTMDDLAMAKTMEETYSKKKHPQDPMSTAFTNTTIYWRPQLSIAAPSTPEKEPKESQIPTETTSENDKS